MMAFKSGISKKVIRLIILFMYSPLPLLTSCSKQQPIDDDSWSLPQSPPAQIATAGKKIRVQSDFVSIGLVHGHIYLANIWKNKAQLGTLDNTGFTIRSELNLQKQITAVSMIHQQLMMTTPASQIYSVDPKSFHKHTVPLPYPVRAVFSFTPSLKDAQTLHDNALQRHEKASLGKDLLAQKDSLTIAILHHAASGYRETDSITLTKNIRFIKKIASSPDQFIIVHHDGTAQILDCIDKKLHLGPFFPLGKHVADVHDNGQALFLVTDALKKTLGGYMFTGRKTLTAHFLAPTADVPSKVCANHSKVWVSFPLSNTLARFDITSGEPVLEKKFNTIANVRTLACNANTAVLSSLPRDSFLTLEIITTDTQ